MTVAGEPITAVHLPRRIRVDIEINSDASAVAEAALVAEYECREAAVFSNYNWTEWQELSAWDRASCVAHHRMHMLVEAHVNEAVYKHNNAKSKE